jgi:preprotein translocase subunit SecA
VLEHFEKAIMLQVLDQLWREHLAAMDYLRLGIHLRGYAQKDPKQEYKREAFTMFNDMLARFKHEVISTLARVRIQTEAEVEQVEAQRRQAAEALERRMQMQHAEANALPAGAAMPAAAPADAGTASVQRRLQPAAPPPPRPATVVREYPKVGRNDPCPCGSGKKYKQCHGALN